MKTYTITISRPSSTAFHLLLALIFCAFFVALGIMLSGGRLTLKSEGESENEIHALSDAVRLLDPVQNFLHADDETLDNARPNTSLYQFTNTFHESLVAYVSGKGSLTHASHILALAIDRPVKASEMERIIEKLAERDLRIADAFGENGHFVKEIVARRMVDNANVMRFGRQALPSMDIY